MYAQSQKSGKKPNDLIVCDQVNQRA